MARKTEDNTNRAQVLKNVIANKPWLYVILQAIYSYRGLSIEELREIVGLAKNVVERGLWWLNKYGLIEGRNGKFSLKPDYIKAFEEFLFKQCNLKNMHIIVLDEVYIVIYIKDRKVHYWSLPRKLYEEILQYEKLSGGEYSVSEISHILNIDIGTAKKILKLRALLKKCRT